MRRHINYANVVATLALVFAMSGGALAAKHYLINSTKQINPKVLKKLKGNAGKTGATGKEGPQGKEGPTGKEGAAGKEGKEGPLLNALPSGKTETGDWGVGFTAASSGDAYRATASFPIPLAAGTDNAHTIFVSGTSAPHCSGVGNAEPGYLCVYQGYTENANTPTSGNIFNPETGASLTSSAHGFSILLSAAAAGLTTVDGSYAVTAP
jgi:hypothetical protein